MGSKNEMTRKEFLALTFTLIGSTAALSNCDDDNNNATGTGGRGGSTGTGGSGTGTAGSGGTGAGGTGTGGTGTSTGTAGSGGGAAPPAACTDPLPETQLADSTGHSHTFMVPVSALDSATAMTFSTSVTLAHQHMVTLQPGDLSALKSGGSVTVTSSVADLHAHMYSVSCH